MITPVVQRWRERRDTYRPAGEPIETRHYEVASFREDAIARAFVEQHHYSGCYPAARRRFGLYRGAELVGVAVFSQPTNDRALLITDALRASIELGRFVLLDDVPANGESWFLARCFEQLRTEDGMEGVISFSDPLARTAIDGTRVFPGHVGTIYQASNATYLGRATPRSLKLLPDGTVFSERARSKIRVQDRGHRYAAEQLVRYGAGERHRDEPPAAWLRRVLPAITRTVRHPGNHKYVWMLDRRARKHLPASLAYPKLDVARSA